MEFFDANNFDEGVGIDLKNEAQIETLYALLMDEENVLVRWTETSGEKVFRKSTILYGHIVSPRLKDGRFVITATTQQD